MWLCRSAIAGGTVEKHEVRYFLPKDGKSTLPRVRGVRAVGQVQWAWIGWVVWRRGAMERDGPGSGAWQRRLVLEIAQRAVGCVFALLASVASTAVRLLLPVNWVGLPPYVGPAPRTRR